MYGISTLPYYTNTSMTPYGYARGGIAGLRPGYGIGGKIKKAVKSITKPVAKVLDKIVPNEIKPALPFIAAAVPFFGPALAASTLGMTAAQYAAIAPYIQSGASLFSQLSQEGAAERGISPVSLGLSALQGYLAAPGAGDALSSGQIIGNVGDKVITAGNLSELGTNLSSNISPEAIRGLSLTEGSNVYNALQGSPITSPTFLQSTENLARNIGSYGAETFEKGRAGFENIIGGTAGTKDLVNLGKAYVPGALQASGELAYNAALDAQKKYEQEMLAMGNLTSSNRQQQIDYIKSAMRTAGFNDDEIGNALTRSGFNQGGYAGYAQGGIMDLGGMELDYRAKGGFVPIGKKERADDVPARLSKNEFVFTAKAVRNAGGGDIRKGAKKMYQIMNQLEAMA